MGSPADTVKQLNAAREIVLRDPALYPQVLPGVLPVISSASALPVRRWGADFLAETFASAVLSAEQKQKMCVSSALLDTLRGYMDRKEELGHAEDPAVLKAAVQCAASVYPLIFRHAISSPSDSDTWNKMAAIKSSILRKMDFLPAGVVVSCAKFLAIVVQVQTPGLIADPRRPEQNEVSLALLPRDHAVLKVGNLEAEASGLLDRLLTVLQEDGVAALVVTATLNSLSPLVHRRASISNKILGTILSFNPLKLAAKPCTGKDKVAVKSMTRTTMSFLLNVLKRNPQHNLAGRIQQHIDRLRHNLGEAFSEANQLKRASPDEPTDGLNNVKRQRLDANVMNGATTQQQQQRQFATMAPLPPGPVTAAQLFTLTDNEVARNLHAEQLPAHIAAQLVPALIASIDAGQLDAAINIVRARYLEVTSRPPLAAANAARAVVGDDDDDYDPATAYDGETERVMNDLDRMPSQVVDHGIEIGHFQLPKPPLLSQAQLEEHGKLAVMNLFNTLADRDRELKEKGAKSQEVPKGLDRPGPGPETRDGWLKIIIRIATRSRIGLVDIKNVRQEQEERGLAKKGKPFKMVDAIREALFNYVTEDFRRRMNDATSWFTEEWYCERFLEKEFQDEGEIKGDDPTPKCTYWTLRFLDTIIPYLDTKDNKILIRFFSEIPSLDERALSRLVKVADDPERVNMTVQTLLYLVMFRFPVREAALDAMEKLWRENEDAKKAAEKHLLKWRPALIPANTAEVKTEMKTET